MDQGFYRPTYRDKKTGRTRVSKVYWARDPVDGRRVSTGARTVEGVRAWREERERRRASPHYAASHAATVGQWIDRVNDWKRERKAAGTAAMYKSKFGHVERIFGSDAPMASITPEAVDRYVEQRQAERATNNTIGKELTAIVQLAKHAKRRGEYAGDISALRPVGFSINYVPRTAHLQAEWLPQLAAHLDTHELAAVKVIVATSARHSEYLALQAGDVDTDRWLVSLRGTKTERARRVVPIPSIFRDLLTQALPHLEPKWLRITKELPVRCKKAKIPRLTPNDLRRTHATWLIEAGADKRLVADSLGHVDSKMVERVYGHADPAATLAVLEAQIAVVKASKSPAPRTSTSKSKKTRAKPKTRR